MQNKSGVTAFVLAGEHPAGAAETDGHFVGDQEHVVLSRQFADAAEIAAGVYDDAGRRLHERLDHQRRDPRVMLGQQAIERGQRMLQQAIFGHAGRQAIGVGHGGAEGFEQQRAEQFVEAGHAADADRPQRIAVIGLAQGHVTGLLRLGVAAAAANTERPSSARLPRPWPRRR